MRQVVLDTETTGLEPEHGHRIIEIGAVELIDRKLTGRRLHQYLNPQRAIEDGALQVHGITNEFLVDKPKFGEVVDDLVDFIHGAELVIHNAPFDVGFLDHELSLLTDDRPPIRDICQILDTLILAREIHPGQRNSLDALCKRYEVDNSARSLHGALLDAEILADVYLAMTGGQVDLELTLDSAENVSSYAGPVAFAELAGQLKVQVASGEEQQTHQQRLQQIQETSGDCLWLRKEG